MGNQRGKPLEQANSVLVGVSSLGAVDNAV